ncbi:hypothetical protein SEPCBS57363_001098 [Sporothrix epigloea]|uniref:RTA1 domain protein n=1 Tax=Sporothrix epigloea TaxID=1892477 RepID=A0ABP0D8C9_9PEZI
MEYCRALATPNTMWTFCPNLGASVFFLVLFAGTTAAHVFQAAHYKKTYCWVIIMSSLWQLLTYVFRTIIWGLTASRFGPVFVVLDIVAFVIQVYGAATATAQNLPTDEVLRDLHIYMGGVGVQLFFILVCFAFGIKLWSVMRQEAIQVRSVQPAMLLLYTQFTVLSLITIRIVFRIVEYSGGLKSTIPNHEVFQYCLDTLPMFIAIFMYNVVHPGRIMRESETEMPSLWPCCGKR